MKKRTSILDISARKRATPIVVLTAYTAYHARLLDPHVDILLVGDSLGMVIYGMDTTLPVTLDMMIQHGKAVVNASSKALTVVDMPFGSYQASHEQAYLAAAKVMVETGCQAVKLEGGKEMADTIRFLVDRGIPVMAHVALMPQRIHAMGGFRYQGRSDEEAARIEQDALAVEQAGAFAVVIEGAKESVARAITEKLHIPTIGIGASPACDGQVLVTEDILGLSEYSPSFVKQYAKLDEHITRAVTQYAEEVRTRAFPTEAHCFGNKNKDTKQ